MKMKAAVVVLLMMLMVSMASATIDGKIKSVTWGMTGELEPIVVKPLVLIENTGDERAQFHIVIAVDKDVNRYAGACWVTDEIGVGKTGMTWPKVLRLPKKSDLPYVQVELYSDACVKSKLLDVKKIGDSDR